MRMVSRGRLRKVFVPVARSCFYPGGCLFPLPASVSTSIPALRNPCSVDDECKSLPQLPRVRLGCFKELPVAEGRWFHSVSSTQGGEVQKNADAASESGTKVKRKKLKGKRAVVRWLKHFRWKKKKEYERMTPEEKIQYKLNKARRKEERLIKALNKIEPKESSPETIHDPEILTPEEHFYFLKMGLKCKNYVPVGRRGIYQGVILNMHLHWKKHQTLQVIVKTFTPEEVKEIASELARLSGGIVLDIVEEDTIIMYRGKNYAQPPTEIMSPRVLLSRKKALDKSKYFDALRNVRRFIPRLEQQMKFLQFQGLNRSNAEDKDAGTSSENRGVAFSGLKNFPNTDSLNAAQPREYRGPRENYLKSSSDLELSSDTDDLSDIFETDTETDTEEAMQPPLYLDQFERLTHDKKCRESDDFQEQLRQISQGSKPAANNSENISTSAQLDEVDLIFLQAASLLRKKKR